MNPLTIEDYEPTCKTLNVRVLAAEADDVILTPVMGVVHAAAEAPPPEFEETSAKVKATAAEVGAMKPFGPKVGDGTLVGMRSEPRQSWEIL